MSNWITELESETIALITKTNELHTFMTTKLFYTLPRPIKDLLYDKFHAMLNYLQILGKLCEIYHITLPIGE